MTPVRAAALVAALCASGAVLSAQQSSWFRVGSELVVVDLIPTAKDGRFVDDLSRGEVQILEDGKPRTVEFFRLVAGGESAAASPVATSPAAANVAAAPSNTDEPVRVAVAVDLVSTSAEDLPKVQDAIVRLVENELPQGTEVMVVSFARAVTIEQAFTPDRTAIVAAVRRLSPAPAGRLTFQEILDTASRDCTLAGDKVVFPALVVAGKTFIHESRLDLAFSSAALSTLAASLGVLPGRKHVVLYSRGYPLDPVPHAIELVAAAASLCGGGAVDYRRMAAEELSASDEGSGAGSPFRTLIDRANRAQVSFYAIDARSLFVTSAQSRDSVTARSTRRGLLTQTMATEAALPQEYLRSVAADTGGRSFLNSNDLSQGLRRAWTDASRYYLIGFTPDPRRKKGGYHRIEVKVARGDLDLRFRRGYYDSTEKEVAAADVARALTMPGVYQRAGLEIETAMQAGTLRVTAYLPPSEVHFDAAGDRHSATIGVHAALRDDQGKLVGGRNLFDRDITLRLTAAQLSNLSASDNIEIPVEVPLPRAGAYSLTVVARASGGWIGTHVAALTVK